MYSPSVSSGGVQFKRDLLYLTMFYDSIFSVYHDATAIFRKTKRVAA